MPEWLLSSKEEDFSLNWRTLFAAWRESGKSEGGGRGGGGTMILLTLSRHYKGGRCHDKDLHVKRTLFSEVLCLVWGDRGTPVEGALKTSTRL